DTASAAVAAVATKTSAIRRFTPYTGALLLAVATGAVVWRVREPVSVSNPVSRFSIDVSNQLQDDTRNPLAISPDGRHLVSYAPRHLFLRNIDQLEAVAMSGTEGTTNARVPFFSPDSQWVGYWQDGQLKKIAVSGGAPVTLCGGIADLPIGISWSEDG